MLASASTWVGAALGELAGGAGGRIQVGGDGLDDDVAVGDHSVQAVIVSPQIGRAPTPNSRMCWAAAVRVSC